MLEQNDTRKHVTDHAVLLSRIADLERDREKLYRELEEMRHDLGTAVRAKSDFLARMSHDMRSPLSKIMGFTEIMREGIAGPLTEVQKEYLGDVYESARQLHRLIKDMTGCFESTGRQDGAGVGGQFVG
jgi:signal transduction histidine kinase